MIDYAVNPDKTEQRLFESCLNCSSVENASRDMERTKRRYNKTGGVQGYHIIQSFKPGELTPEQTHTIGVEFAKTLHQGQSRLYRLHPHRSCALHNHIIWNSTSLDCTRKFRNFWGSTRAVRRLSDTLCVENGLSIVENPKPEARPTTSAGGTGQALPPGAAAAGY